jgi:hypothetical protein
MKLIKEKQIECSHIKSSTTPCTLCSLKKQNRDLLFYFTNLNIYEGDLYLYFTFLKIHVNFSTDSLSPRFIFT